MNNLIDVVGETLWKIFEKDRFQLGMKEDVEDIS
jgi:hypothetical protein